MRNYRIAKYNPKYRDEQGAYQNNEWNSFYDIGKVFNNKTLNISEYIKVEDAYINAICMLMKENRVSQLGVYSLEKNYEIGDLKEEIEKYKEHYSSDMLDLFISIKEGDILNIYSIRLLCRLILREHIWCRLNYNSQIFIHFGYDYYMYVGLSNDCSVTCKNNIHNLGIYIEEFESPYVEKS